MRHFRDEVAITQNTVIDGHAFRGDGLDSLGKQLVRQTLIHYFEYTLAIDRLLAKPLPKKHRDLRCLLLVGMSAVDHLRQPEHTSVNAAVETASLLGKEWAKGLINGVLRTFIRQRYEIRSACQESETAALNHPKWLIRTVEEDWPDQADSIFKANLTPPPMTLRVNQLLISRDDYAGLLSEKGLDHELSLRAPGAISLKRAVPVRELPGFASGMVSVQDESAQLASLVLAPTAQESILDACAAPGGKTGHLLELASDANLTAIDIDSERCSRIKDNLQRLNLDAEIVCQDLVQYASEGRKFDAVLLDAPCSGTGVIRRRPDIKLLRKAADIDKLHSLQKSLLRAAWTLVNPGGRLLYATCSILRRENDAVISHFLSETTDAKAAPISLPESISLNPGLQYLPQPFEQDGFFYALLKKEASA